MFCSTRESVRHLHASLLERGFSAVALSGELTQSERTHALQALRDGRARVCVATDVAARGLDLPDLGLVIHADLPNDREALLHRSGRTGRAGKKGVSVLIVPYTRRRRAEQLLTAANLRADLGGTALGRRDPDQGPRAAAARAAAGGRAAGRGARGRQGPARRPRARNRSPPRSVRLHRAELPAPEELFENTPEPAGPRERPPRREAAHGPRAEAERGPRPDGDAVWFRMNVGRARNADPRWLIPLICRRGHVTKREIGSIKISERETRFEIARAVADRFAVAAGRPDKEDASVRIEPLRTERPAPSSRRPPRPAAAGG